MTSRLAFALEVAQEAAALTLRTFTSTFETEYKADNSPVTIADLQAERLIRDRIHARYPSDGILGEEEGEVGNRHERWVIDPIDGTRSFVCGVPLFAMLLSYEVDEQPLLGVAILPALNQVFHAEIGAGAFLNGSPIHVSKVTDWSRVTISVGGHRSVEIMGLTSSIAKIAMKSQATRTWCDAFGHLLVAQGRIEAMIDPRVSHYDISAVSLIVREAGGRFTDLQGQEKLSTQALSSNGLLHEQLLRDLDT